LPSCLDHLSLIEPYQRLDRALTDASGTQQSLKEALSSGSRAPVVGPCLLDFFWLKKKSLNRGVVVWLGAPVEGPCFGGVNEALSYWCIRP
jgi:hypothetical protein